MPLMPCVCVHDSPSCHLEKFSTLPPSVGSELRARALSSPPVRLEGLAPWQVSVKVVKWEETEEEVAGLVAVCFV